MMPSPAWLVALPIIIPLGTAGLLLMLFGLSANLQRAVTLLGSGLHLAASALLFMHVAQHGVTIAAMGDWPSPFGIILAADAMGSLFTLGASITGLACVIASLGALDAARVRHGFHVLFQAMMGGVSAAFLTGDLFNLYVWFEIILISSLGLMALGGTRAQIDAAVKYGMLNLIATTIFLIAVALLYGLTGTLNMADLSGKAAAADPGARSAIAVLLLLGFGMKGAVFPLFFWLPASYHAPVPVAQAAFAALLTKVGVYALLRVFTLILDPSASLGPSTLSILSGATMLIGGMGAFIQNDVRRVFAFIVVNGIGFMLAGLAIGTEMALSGASLYAFHSMLATAAIFLILGLVARSAGSMDLAALGGLYAQRPLIAVLFFIAAFSLAGVPPFFGFWPKFALFQAAASSGHFGLLTLMALSAFFCLAATGRVWVFAFLRGEKLRPSSLAMPGASLVLSAGGLSLFVLGAGLWPQPLAETGARVARGLSDTAAYIATVLPGKGG